MVTLEQRIIQLENRVTMLESMTFNQPVQDKVICQPNDWILTTPPGHIFYNGNTTSVTYGATGSVG